MWARTDLDAFLLFEAALRNYIPLYTVEPEAAERERLTFSGSVIVWDETAMASQVDGNRKVKGRWTHTVPWSASRMIRNYLVCRSSLNTRPIQF
jgi:hypothetical protein